MSRDVTITGQAIAAIIKVVAGLAGMIVALFWMSPIPVPGGIWWETVKFSAILAFACVILYPLSGFKLSIPIILVVPAILVALLLTSGSGWYVGLRGLLFAATFFAGPAIVVAISYLARKWRPNRTVDPGARGSP